MNIVGGAASMDGVRYLSENFSVKAVREDDDSINVTFHELRQHKLLPKLRRIPFIRGIVLLLTILWDNKLFLIVSTALSIPWIYFFPSHVQQSFDSVMQVRIPNWLVLSILLSLEITVRILSKPVFLYHGAEHKVLDAYDNKDNLVVESVKNYSRISDSCGTNFLVFFIPINFTLTLYFQGRYYIFLMLVSLSVAYELFRFNPKLKALRPFYFIGTIIQRFGVTMEPSDKELEVAISSLSKLIQLEQGLIQKSAA